MKDVNVEYVLNMWKVGRNDFSLSLLVIEEMEFKINKMFVDFLIVSLLINNGRLVIILNVLLLFRVYSCWRLIYLEPVLNLHIWEFVACRLFRFRSCWKRTFFLLISGNRTTPLILLIIFLTWLAKWSLRLILMPRYFMVLGHSMGISWMWILDVSSVDFS